MAPTLPTPKPRPISVGKEVAIGIAGGERFGQLVGAPERFRRELQVAGNLEVVLEERGARPALELAAKTADREQADHAVEQVREKRVDTEEKKDGEPNSEYGEVVDSKEGAELRKKADAAKELNLKFDEQGYDGLNQKEQEILRNRVLTMVQRDPNLSELYNAIGSSNADKQAKFLENILRNPDLTPHFTSALERVSQIEIPDTLTVPQRDLAAAQAVLEEARTLHEDVLGRLSFVDDDLTRFDRDGKNNSWTRLQNLKEKHAETVHEQNELSAQIQGYERTEQSLERHRSEYLAAIRQRGGDVKFQGDKVIVTKGNISSEELEYLKELTGELESFRKETLKPAREQLAEKNALLQEETYLQTELDELEAKQKKLVREEAEAQKKLNDAENGVRNAGDDLAEAERVRTRAEERFVKDMEDVVQYALRDMLEEEYKMVTRQDVEKAQAMTHNEDAQYILQHVLTRWDSDKEWYEVWRSAINGRQVVEDYSVLKDKNTSTEMFWQRMISGEWNLDDNGKTTTHRVGGIQKADGSWYSPDEVAELLKNEEFMKAIEEPFVKGLLRARLNMGNQFIDGRLENGRITRGDYKAIEHKFEGYLEKALSENQQEVDTIAQMEGISGPNKADQVADAIRQKPWLLLLLLGGMAAAAAFAPAVGPSAMGVAASKIAAGAGVAGATASRVRKHGSTEGGKVALRQAA